MMDLNNVKKQYQFYRQLGERAMAQVDDEALFWQGGDDVNSIAILVGHIAGNMRSRWTDFLTSDGEKEWRDRDREFEPVIKSREELDMHWTAGWHCVLKALDELTEDDLERIVYIRNQGHTVIEAVNRQLAHYAYHVGQIVFICKMMSAKPWDSLSIPRNESKSYNKSKFDLPKSRGHFTDEYLDS